ncbi:hypothetical protein GGR21_003753 [Dysgonomonas hofstadii]|uniref:Lipoprotein n=1 Tax=Dysgonomonas hofstadii TaxID=637886 RepID=A0A840CZK5_9BACT|nr:hypothetical protein [Dysgonomonas hofstadii]MBB4037832.1 hypothetical protein [Dysgonomonas hofstadii]
MKHIIYILTAVLLSSCSSTFYYSSLNTANEYVEKVDNGDFLIETDSLWIAYCFKGPGAPMQITVFNKLDEPLYVDWERSALIIDDKAFSYAEAAGSFTWNNYNPDGTVYSPDSTYTFDDEIRMMSDHISFIPPKAMISEIPLSLDPTFKHLDKKLYRNATMADKYQEVVKTQRADFSMSDSPLRFSSYITVYAQPDEPMVFEQDFYLASLFKTGIRPGNMAGDMINRGDLFYVEQPANNNALYTTLGIVAASGLIVLGALYGDGTYEYVDDGYDYDY